ncbi:aldose 1-epimerase family protein [Ruminococcaceae bacterium OttesenSCG-928-I18]|nr:aldose 1-epimerase family protein [Ruminococcaceae bacterium OttesenSCG-928-I18]
MTRQEILSKVGSMQQLAYIRPVTHREGLASGLDGYLVKNGELCFEALGDKCLDIGDFSYKGVNFHFLAKPGLIGRTPYDTHGQEAQRSIMGGLFFTSGAENICAPCTVEGKHYPMHGRLRTTPSQHRTADAFWDGDNYLLKLCGEMREAELFGENIVLRRSIETVFGEKSVRICDEFTNEAFRSEPLMLLYHFNLGYPLLDETARVVLPASETCPRDEISRSHQDAWSEMPPPRPNEPEYVFLHSLKTDPEGNTFAALINEKIGLGFKLGFNQRQLPYFMQWKSTASGDYVMGLEPANSSVYGRPYHEKEGTVHRLGAFETERIELTLTVLDGAQEIDTLKQELL